MKKLKSLPLKAGSLRGRLGGKPRYRPPARVTVIYPTTLRVDLLPSNGGMSFSELSKVGPGGCLPSFLVFPPAPVPNGKILWNCIIDLPPLSSPFPKIFFDFYVVQQGRACWVVSRIAVAGGVQNLGEPLPVYERGHPGAAAPLTRDLPP